MSFFHLLNTKKDIMKTFGNQTIMEWKKIYMEDDGNRQLFGF